MSFLIIVSQLLVSALFGTMLFFSFVMAPLIFVNLDKETAGRFLRALFPWYYLVLALLSGLAAAMLFLLRPVETGILLGVASMALFSRQVLTPVINNYRDLGQAGDSGADVRFNQLHRLSVLINFVQLAAVTLVLVELAGR